MGAILDSHDHLTKITIQILQQPQDMGYCFTDAETESQSHLYGEKTQHSFQYPRKWESKTAKFPVTPTSAEIQGMNQELSLSYNSP